MQITHTVPHIDEEASGPSYSVPRLCQSLVQCGDEVRLRCLAAGNRIDGVALHVHRQWPLLRSLAVSSDLASALRADARRVDVVHNHSLWSMVNMAAGWVVPGHRAKLVVSPRGTLSSWALARKKMRKRLLWPLQGRTLQRADLLHATCTAELAEIRALGLTAPVAVIPNGVDLPDPLPGNKPTDACTLLFLSRIHPKKGIDDLLHVWQQLQERHPDWRLVIAGRGERAHVEHVQTLASELGLQRVEFPGPLYGAEKLAAYGKADLFVLPTHSENFGLVVAEALAHGCPAVVSHGAPWEGLGKHGCGWWVEQGREQLADALNDAMALPASVRSDMGSKGRSWMEQEFSWSAIGQQLHAAYQWLVDGGMAPSCIHFAPGGQGDKTGPSAGKTGGHNGKAEKTFS